MRGRLIHRVRGASGRAAVKGVAGASLFVEDRFGYGYAPNWGNPKAVVFFVGFLLVCAAMILLCFMGFLS